jgi:DNA ligase-1
LRHHNIPAWLFEESYHVVGDLAETMALLMPQNTESSSKTLTEWIAEINNLADKTEEEKKLWLNESWAMLDSQERFVFNKLLTGSFRVGVSQNLVIKALADIPVWMPLRLPIVLWVTGCPKLIRTSN